MKSLILIACMLQTALAAPQLISFKDGKVGVNFLGYHAEAGLGGGQNGANGGLLGGLHASAGTPFGQNAAAGLGGNVNGRAAGALYAGAQATPDVGASAVLGGDTSQGGFSGTDAYANGKVSSRTRTIAAENTQKTYESAYPQYPEQPATENVNVIQKIRPPKKYHSSESFDYVEKYDYKLNNNVALTTNENKNIYDMPQDKPAADSAASNVLTKAINKTTLATPHHSDEKFKVAPTLNIDSNVSNHYNQFANNEFKTMPSAASTLLATRSNTPLPVSLSHSLNGDNSSGNIVKSADDNHTTGIITVTRERTKLRTHAHKHRRNRQQKRINANRQHQSSKTIVKVVEQERQLQQHPSETQQQARQNISQIYHQQQHHARRQLIAPPPLPAHDSVSRPCDSMNQECKNHNREVRSDVVQSALQIPIGILQSLQHSLGNLGLHKN